METLQRTANRGSLATGYDIDNSLKFERASNEAVETTNQAAGNRKTWTFSAWIKRTALSEDYHTIFGAGYTNIQIMSNNRPRLVLYDGTSYYADPEMLLRDTSAWYHIVVQLDTTQSTASDRVKWWINGDRVTVFNNATYANITQNADCGVGHPGSYGSGGWLRLGRFFSGDEGFDGYMADVYYLNGTAAEADDFGEYDEDSGIWIPKAYTGSGYGTQGFHYKFDNASDLGEDSSGEGHDATSLSNISAADQATDTPTNNFATGNPLVYFSNPTMATFNAITEGATQFKKGAGGWETMTSSIAVTSGKWYCEIQNISAPESVMMGITPADSEIIFRGGRISYHMGASSGDGGVAQYGYNGTLYVEGVGTTYSPSPTWANGTDVMGIALDMDNGKVYFAKGNTWMNNGDPTTGSTGTGAVDIPDYTTKPYVFGYSLYATNSNGRMNFGGYTSGSISSAASDANGYGTFEYAPPSGYYALCTKNLAEYG